MFDYLSRHGIDNMQSRRSIGQNGQATTFDGLAITCEIEKDPHLLASGSSCHPVEMRPAAQVGILHTPT